MEDSKPSRFRNSLGTIAAYGFSITAIILLGIELPKLLPQFAAFTAYFPALIAVLLLSLAGSLALKFGHVLVGRLTSKVFATIAFFALALPPFLSFLQRSISISLPPGLEIPLLLLPTGLAVNGFANSIANDGGDQRAFVIAKRFAGSLGLLSMLLLTLLYASTAWAQYLFLYPLVAYVVLSFSIALMFAGREGLRRIGVYVQQSSGSWTWLAFGLGVLASAVAFPKAPLYNTLLLSAVLVLAAVAVGYLGWKMYVLGSSRLEAIQQDAYEKFRHKLELSLDDSYAFLDRAAEEFARTGEKSRLVAALAFLAASTGNAKYQDCEASLSSIIAYRLPPFHSISPFGSVWAEQEVKRRIQLANKAIKELIAKVSVIA